MNYKIITCECGLDDPAHTGPNIAMKTVGLVKGPARRQRNTLYRTARTFRVLPCCVRPFMKELKATELCRSMAAQLVLLPIWRRLLRPRRLARLWNLRRLTLQRRLGPTVARRKASSLIWVTLWTPRVRSEMP